jgi:dTDP-4-dehydrorhamnose 3,5-epimerase
VNFVETPLAGAFVVSLDRHDDERGFFARSFCAREFAARGLDSLVAQCNVSWNRARHTLRGMHYQAAPHREAKLVRCVAGAIFDVIVDLRPGSPTVRRWTAVTLTAESRDALYVPADFAHGFLTLSDGSEVLYQMSTEHQSDAARGLRWNDPALGITWPHAPAVIGERDANYPYLEDIAP